MEMKYVVPDMQYSLWNSLNLQSEPVFERDKITAGS